MHDANGSPIAERTLTKRHACLFQDSAEHYVSIQVAVLSILDHEPNWHIHVYLTNEDSWLTEWLARIPSVEIHRAESAQNGFNAKPLVILDCLKRTKAEVVWFDSDMLLTRPVSPLLDSIAGNTFVIAEDPPGDWPNGTEMRTRGWGLEVGRSLQKTLNSCFVRIHPEHLALAIAWSDAVQRDDYVEFQRKHWSERPAYFLGDQDALNALIGSTRFAHIAVAILRCNQDIAQCFHANGYPWSSRLQDFSGVRPPVVHAQGEKPWIRRDTPPVYLDVSLYKLLARRYGLQLKEQAWLVIQTKQGKILEFIFRGNPSLTGLIPAMLEAGRGMAGRVLHSRRKKKLRGMIANTDLPDADDKSGISTSSHSAQRRPQTIGSDSASTIKRASR